MAQERFRFNNASYGSDVTITPEPGNTYFLRTGTPSGDLSTTTSSWEGARALVAKTSGNSALFKKTGNAPIDNGTYYADVLFYIDSSETNGNSWSLFVTAQDSLVHYSWLNCAKNGSGNYEFKIQSYAPTPGVETHATVTTTQACGSWVRLKVKVNSKCVEWVRFWNAAAVATMDADGTNEGAAVTQSSEASPVTTFGDSVVWESVSQGGADATATTARMDDLLFGDTISLTRVPPNISAAASETATGTAAATLTRTLAGAESVTASATATAGLTITADAAPSVTADGSADASVITTHDAEASSIITASSTAATTMVRPLNAAATVTASAVAAMANQTAADGVIQALGVARIVIDGETSPGFLYSTVAKNVLTS